jgi:hypothetical protein
MKSIPMPRHCRSIGIRRRHEDVANILKQEIIGTQLEFSMMLEFVQYSLQEGHHCKDRM